MIIPGPLRRTVVLDSDGVVKYLRGDERVRAMFENEVVQMGSRLILPSAVLVEAARAGIGPSLLEGLVREVHLVAPIDVGRACEASGLIDYAVGNGHADVGLVDALVAVEAFRTVPSIIITSDPSDMRLLCDSDPTAGKRIAIWRT